MSFFIISSPPKTFYITDLMSCLLLDCGIVNEFQDNHKMVLLINTHYCLEINVTRDYAIREEELNENFFHGPFSCPRIHANCKVLLKTHHQCVGSELMDIMVCVSRRSLFIDLSK
ncbi:hypothetical protein HN51_036477 [Arachis hypogaea]|nr:Conserved oligomeric Golgi complex subunit [Arachis hypogaea]